MTSINSLASSTSLLGQTVNTIKTQLASLQVQMTSGEKATTYSGMGTGEGFAIAARSQLANITGYQNTATNVNTTIDVANTALQEIATTAGDVQSAAAEQAQTLNSNGQTAGQASAISQLSSILGTLNTQGGNGYVFSGAATNTPPVVSGDELLNGNGLQAGLTTLINQRAQADVGGTSNPGRLTITIPSTSPASTTVNVANDNTVFGMQLASVTSTLTGATATLTPASGSTPASLAIDLDSASSGTNPSPGDQLTATFNMPDGTQQTIQLTATTTNPPPSGSFLIGTTPAQTATNLQTALSSSVSTVANTALVASSAVEATNDFFDSPPMRVDLTSPATATTATGLVAGTSANTVIWYTGGNSTSARASQVAQVAPATTIQYGVQANEVGIESQLKAVALYAAFTTSPSDPNASAQISAVSASVSQSLSTQTSQQSISDIQTDLANAQTSIQSATALTTQTQATLQTLVSNIETVSPDQVASEILQLQTDLQAAYQTTSMISQLSLVKFLPIP